MGAQILAPILVGIYLGKWIDEYFGTEKWAIILTLFGVFSGMYLVIKSVINMSNED